MIAASQQLNGRRWVLVFVAALFVVLGTILSCASASAASLGVAETRVRASAVVVEVPVGPPERIAAGQRLGEEPSRVVDAVATGVAAESEGGGWLATRLAMRNERGAISSGSRFNDDQEALIQLAKDAKRRGGLSMDEADTLATWADELGLPGHAPAVHPGRPGFGGTTIHINIGPIKHIPVLP